GDRILVMENTWYSVISPEGCASILFRDASKAPIAAEAMKVTAYDLGELGIADEIIPEPIGGAHRDYDMAAKYVKETIVRHLRELLQIPVDELVERRIHKYGMMGSWDE
ncbi:MAG: acetyl-CoA carboxylase carboxyl transferase subunit alpha, partial [Candidatus Neomarinimicrobiota bacterium]